MEPDGGQRRLSLILGKERRDRRSGPFSLFIVFKPTPIVLDVAYNPVPHPTWGEEICVGGGSNRRIERNNPVPVHFLHWDSESCGEVVVLEIAQITQTIALPVPVFVLDAHAGNWAIHEHIPHEAADAVRLLSHVLTRIVQRDQHGFVFEVFREPENPRLLYRDCGVPAVKPGADPAFRAEIIASAGSWDGSPFLHGCPPFFSMYARPAA